MARARILLWMLQRRPSHITQSSGPTESGPNQPPFALSFDGKLVTFGDQVVTFGASSGN
jgi:hypothetical protein